MYIALIVRFMWVALAHIIRSIF